MGLIRTILAISVVFAHSGAPFDISRFEGIIFVGGRSAVQLFFIVSGYLITEILISPRGYTSLRAFYANRALRVYPIYFVVCAFVLLTSPRSSPMFIVYDQLAWPHSALILAANVGIFGMDWLLKPGILSSQSIYSTTAFWVPQAWTLGLELVFYVIAPFVVRSVPRILFLLLLSLALRVKLLSEGLGWGDGYWEYRFFPTELALFMAGALARHWALPWWRSRARIERAQNVGTAVLVVVCCTYFLVPVPQAVKVVPLYLSFIALMPLAFVYQARSRLDRWIGDLSYPIYIGHMFALYKWGALFPHVGVSRVWTIYAGIHISVILFAVLLKVLVGDPIERVRARIRERRHRNFEADEPQLGAA